MPECSCAYGQEGELPEAFSEKMRKAIKQHKCCECGRTIERGELYRYASGIWEGRPNSYKTCLDCRILGDVFFCGGWAFGTLWDSFREWLDYGEDQSLEGFLVGDDMRIERLTPRARNMALEIAQKILTEYLEKNPFRIARRLKAKPNWEIWRWQFYKARVKELKDIEKACDNAQYKALKRLAATN